MAAAEPSKSDDAPPSVAAPPTINRIGRAYLIGPAVSAACLTVTTPAPSRVGDELGVTDGPDGDVDGLVVGFGFRLLPFWFSTSWAAFMVCALSALGSGR